MLLIEVLPASFPMIDSWTSTAKGTETRVWFDWLAESLANLGRLITSRKSFTMPSPFFFDFFTAVEEGGSAMESVSDIWSLNTHFPSQAVGTVIRQSWALTVLKLVVVPQWILITVNATMYVEILYSKNPQHLRHHHRSVTKIEPLLLQFLQSGGTLSKPSPKPDPALKRGRYFV